MTTDENLKSDTKKTEMTFVCKNCKETKPFEEMVVITGYFPPLIVCSDCARIVRKKY